MKIELKDLLTNYVLGDGQIISFEANLNYQDRNKSRASVTLIIRKSAGKNKLEKSKIELQFDQLTEIGINEDFGSDYYSDITLVQQENDFYYLSLDPYGNTGEPQ